MAMSMLHAEAHARAQKKAESDVKARSEAADRYAKEGKSDLLTALNQKKELDYKAAKYLLMEVPIMQPDDPI